MLSNTRLYGAAIAVVSGGYSVWNATMGDGLTAGGWVMLVLGAVVIAHGVVLVTEVATRFGRASGPLMLAYAVLMLLVQALYATGMLEDGVGMGMNSGRMATEMGWDAGMVALALLMLVSGLIMTRTGGDEMTTRM